MDVKDILNTVICDDCLTVMRQLPDKCVDLVLTDPPYGIEWRPTELFGKKCPQTLGLKDLQSWDKSPTKEYFDEMRRVSIEQIVWGGNYFGDYLGKFKSPLIWNKMTGDNNYADGEMAWTSFKTGTLRIFNHQWCGAFKDSERGVQNLHPTQKPVALFEWCLEKYSKEGDTVLDCYAGSGTLAVACLRTKRNYILIEKEPGYVETCKARIAQAETGVSVKEQKAGQGALWT